MEERLFSEIKKELTGNILPFWEKYARDGAGGFYGALDNDNVPDAKEWRSIVMVSRYLWSYSAAARLFGEPSYLGMADDAFRYMMRTFFDSLNGGMYWSVSSDGKPLLARKQVYGEAFSIYALSEYAAAVKELRCKENQSRRIMDQALALFALLERFARDRVDGGYAEALAEDWSATKETSLSPKDIDCEKSMNTNLHVMEAYTNLHRTLSVVYPEKLHELRLVGEALASLIRVHTTRILNAKDMHLDLYFDRAWKQCGVDEISYGHDIEASWLLWEAGEELGQKSLLEEIRPIVLAIARTSLKEGFDAATGGFENCMSESGVRDTTRIWWNQAEALNGFYNAWEMTGEALFADAAEKVWGWIRDYQVDKKNGDWFAAVSKDGIPVLKEAKGGNWKTSYHNARACMELLRRSHCLSAASCG